MNIHIITFFLVLNYIMQDNPDLIKMFKLQIKHELEASLKYKHIAKILSHPNMAYNGFSSFFNKQSIDELNHANELIDYFSNKCNFYFPDSLDCKLNLKNHDINSIFLFSLDIEESSLDNLILISKHGDIQTSTFIDKFILNQINEIKFINEMLTKLERAYKSSTPDLFLLTLDQYFNSLSS